MIALKLQNASLYFQGNCIFEDINLEVPESAFLCIIGPNGAGKSFLIKSLLGLHRLKSGSAIVLNQPARRTNHQDIGYVPQYKTFNRNFPAQVYEFIASGLESQWPFCISESTKRKVKEALARIRSEALFNKSMSQLSGGELQRVYLARAFVRPRKILILDEPSTGIDMMGEADLYKLLEDYRQQYSCCIVMVTHDVEVARHHSSHVLLMNKKQIWFGHPKESLKTDHLNRAFGHSQHHHGAHPHV